MNSIHDMGGMHGFGPVTEEADEPVFHHEWEARAFGVNLGMSILLGANTDHFRYRIESMPPADYLNSSYFERWLHSAIEGCRHYNYLSDADIDQIMAGQAPETTSPSGPVEGCLPPQIMAVLPLNNTPELGAYDAPARFQVGDRVLTQNNHPTSHTRLARYARGKVGTIVVDAGDQTFPDDHAAFKGPNPCRLYTVKFMATELWGEQANPKDAVHLDLWEPYLLPYTE